MSERALDRWDDRAESDVDHQVNVFVHAHCSHLSDITAGVGRTRERRPEKAERAWRTWVVLLSRASTLACGCRPRAAALMGEAAAGGVPALSKLARAIIAECATVGTVRVRVRRCRRRPPLSVPPYRYGQK